MNWQSPRPSPRRGLHSHGTKPNPLKNSRRQAESEHQAWLAEQRRLDRVDLARTLIMTVIVIAAFIAALASHALELM